MLKDTLLKAERYKTRRMSEFLPTDERWPFCREHLQAPGDLTQETARNELARHYYFSGDQIKIPGVAAAFECTFGFSSGGTGFLVSGHGHVITNKHVVENIRQEVGSIEGETLRYGDETLSLQDARLLDEGFVDLALIEIPELAGRPYIPLAGEPARVGEIVFGIGCPQVMASERVCSAGSIKELSEDMIRSDTEFRIGNSGGPLVNENGELLGVSTSASATGFTLLGYSIHCEKVRQMLARNKLWPQK